MKICMLGAGALGSTIGGTLAMGGSEVYFVDAWKEHVDKIAACFILQGYLDYRKNKEIN